MVELAENNYLVYCFREFPAAEDQHVRADCGCGVAVALGGRVADVLSELPLHFFGGPDLEIFARFSLKDVLVSIARVLGPATKHNYVRARNVQRVPISSFGGQS